MSEQELRAVIIVALLAAFSDREKDDAERAEVKRIAASLAAGTSISLAQLYQDVLQRRVSLEGAASALASPESRQLAYEMAVCVCDADGAQSEAERVFLDGLRAKLGLDTPAERAFTQKADAIAALPLEQGSDAEPRYASTLTRAEMDKMILNYSILNGALELLPDSLASMAIIPLQMKMVYRIGSAHGFELDRGHIRDFLATAGVGLTSQYLEQAAGKLVGGLLKKVGGGLLGGFGRQATSTAFSFATTYALGQVALRYYAGGRQLSAAVLKETFNEMLGEAKGLQGRYASEIRSRARTLDVNQLLSMVKRG